MNIKPVLLLAAALCAAPALAQDAQLSAEEEEALREMAIDINEECSLPERPEVPQGDNVTESALTEVQGEVQSYVDEGNAYLECLSEQEAELGEDATDNERALIASMHNQVVEEMQAVADEFNAAVRSLGE